jgi:predicted ATP-grasp superfamily ATP-dependent carboligase
MANNLPVLLTYAWVRSTYAALRCLSQKKISVYVSDNSRFGMCQQSNLKKKFFQYTDPFTAGGEKFIKDINKIADEIGSLVLIPSHDETEVLAKNHNQLSPKIICPINNWDSIKFANDKAKSCLFAEKIGVNVPVTLKYDSPDEIETILADNDNAFVVKLRKGNSSKGVFYPKNKMETRILVESLQKEYALSKDRLPIIQQKVDGEGWGVSCLFWKGARIAHFTHRRLREKIVTGGTSTLREAASNPILEKMAFDLLDSLKWHGLAMVEFKYDPDSQKGWFIEINPRMWGSISLAINSGVEFPYLLYLCATQGPDRARYEFDTSPKKYPCVARWYLGDLISLVSSRSRRFSFNEIIRMLSVGGSDVLDDLYRDDPGAFFGEIMNYGYRFIKFKSTNPIEKGMLG